MMYGSVWIPAWPVAAAELAGEIAPQTPAAMYGAAGILAINSWAQKAGVKIGMRRCKAQTLCPALKLVANNHDRDALRFEPVLRALDKHIAKIVVLSPGNIIFAARGAIKTAGSAENLAEALIGEIADTAGCEAYVGFAEGMLATQLAARSSQILTPQESLAFIRRQPLESLLIPITNKSLRNEARQCLEMLRRLGLKNVLDVYQLGSSALNSRFGRAGMVLYQLAAGNDIAVAAEHQTAGEFTHSRTCEPPLENTDSVAFAARKLAVEIAEEMKKRNLAGGRLTIRANLENGNLLERSWSIENGSTKDVIDRVRWQLSSWILSDEEGSALTRIELRMSHLVVAGSRPATLWGGPSVNAEQASRSIARIQTLLGENAVLTAQHVGGRTPQREFIERPWSEAPHSTSAATLPWPGAIPRPAPTVIFTSPHPIELISNCGHRLSVNGQGNFECEACYATKPTPSAFQHNGKREQIENYAGPWTIEEQWWSQSHLRRAYLQIATPNGGSLIYRENELWFMEGSYA